MPQASAKTISSGGSIQKAGLMQIARTAASKMKDADLYVKLLNILEEAYHDPRICKIDASGSKKIFCSKKGLKELIHARYFITLETNFGLGAAVMLYEAVEELR